MSLKLYRRHRKECEGKHSEDERTGEFEEGRRGWKRCACIIHAAGTIGGKFNRRQTGQTDWESAKTVTAAWETAGTWGEAPAPQPEVPSASNRVTIDRATKTFLAEFQEHAAFATQKKYRLLLSRFKSFSDDHGYLMIDQWRPEDMREFRSSWVVSHQTAAKNMSMFKNFFEYCLSNEWITRNPARMIKNPRGRDAADKRGEQKLPFSDDEMKRMYDACTKYGNEPRYKWTGEDLADFISISTYTGLRISDVALFHIDRMQPTGEILIRTTKAGTHVHTWVPEWLQERIRDRAKTVGPLIFGDHRTKDLNVITDLWRRKLIRLWDICGPWPSKPHPHRFRHTFARILLQRPNVTVRDVSELLGNTEEMVRKHYAAWVPERQARLTNILKDAFTDKPRPKLVQMPGRS